MQLVGIQSVKRGDYLHTLYNLAMGTDRCILSTDTTYCVADAVHRNYEAGKQLVINSINGSDSLGWVDTLTRVDLNKRFQYFLSVVQPHNTCHNINDFGFYFQSI